MSDMYTWENVIFIPASEAAKNAVGKECYFGDSPADCLARANNGEVLGILERVNPESIYPFHRKDSNNYGCIIPKREPSYIERASKWIEDNNLKVGDYVKILRKTELYENRWGDEWIDEMSDYIGKALKVLKIDSLSGLIRLECDDTSYNFPYFVLEKVEPPKSKYVPFESYHEFIESYKKVEKRIDDCSNIEGYIASCGLWLKDKDWNVYRFVTEIWNYGVVVGDSRINTTKDGDEYYTINEVTKWETLLREYTFLDGTPCGKLMEE